MSEAFEESMDLRVIPGPLVLVVLLAQWVLLVPLVLLDRRGRRAQREILGLKAIPALKGRPDLPDKEGAVK